MNNLKKTTYIAVLIASIMAIVWFTGENLKGGTEECEIAKRMGELHLRLSYDDMDEDNRLIERAGHYANYYEAFCD
jgi:hypothetical protein